MNTATKLLIKSIHASRSAWRYALFACLTKLASFVVLFIITLLVLCVGELAPLWRVVIWLVISAVNLAVCMVFTRRRRLRHLQERAFKLEMQREMLAIKAARQ